MTIDELGEFRREFKPGLETIIAGIIMGVLLMAGGGALTYFAVMGGIGSGGNLPFWREKGEPGWSWGAIALAGAMGIGLMMGGFFLIRWMRSLVSLRVCVCQNGFAVIDRKSTQIVAWEEIDSVQETHLYQRPPVLKGVAKYALPKLMSKSFLVRITGREPFGFDGDTIKGHSKLAQMIKEETDRRNISWEIVEEHG